jgi:hypothetical protein
VNVEDVVGSEGWAVGCVGYCCDDLLWRANCLILIDFALHT